MTTACNEDVQQCQEAHPTYKFIELVVGFEPAQQPAELVVILMLCQANLASENVPRACHQVIEKLGALPLICEQASAH